MIKVFSRRFLDISHFLWQVPDIFMDAFHPGLWLWHPLMHAQSAGLYVETSVHCEIVCFYITGICLILWPSYFSRLFSDNQYNLCIDGFSQPNLHIFIMVPSDFWDYQLSYTSTTLPSGSSTTLVWITLALFAAIHSHLSSLNKTNFLFFVQSSQCTQKAFESEMWKGSSC